MLSIPMPFCFEPEYAEALMCPWGQSWQVARIQAPGCRSARQTTHTTHTNTSLRYTHTCSVMTHTHIIARAHGHGVCKVTLEVLVTRTLVRDAHKLARVQVCRRYHTLHATRSTSTHLFVTPTLPRHLAKATASSPSHRRATSSRSERVAPTLPRLPMLGLVERRVVPQTPISRTGWT
jgi:hypothetical protein